jgi:tetratricopeptide (TPR) repeat protein
MRVRFLFVIPLVAIVACGGAETPSSSTATLAPPDTGEPAAGAHLQRWRRAQEHYRNEAYAEARPLLDRVVARAPKNETAWLLLGDCRYETGAYDAALEAFHRAHALGATALEGGYRYPRFLLAATHAQRGTLDSAFVWLERLLNERRYSHRDALRESEALAPLRGNPRFDELLQAGDGPVPSGRVAGWRHDLDVLLSEVKRLNATYHARPLPDSVRQAAVQLRQDVPTLSDGEVWVRMQMLLAMLGQSHNSIWHFQGADRVDITMFPLSFYVFSDGVHVVDAERSEWIGAEVLRVADTPAAEAMRQIERVVTSETPMKVNWLGPAYLRMPQVLHTLGITDDAGPVSLTLRLRDGPTTTGTLDPVPVERRQKLRPHDLPDTGPPPLWLARPDDGYWMRRLPGRDALYVQINQIIDETAAPDFADVGGPTVESFAVFTTRLRDTLQADRPGALVLDLRRNNGGNTFLYTDLLRRLVAYDARPSTNLYVLAGRNTYSAALNLATDLDRLTDATFVGEPTGGRPNTHGNESAVELPYSGLTAGLSAVYWQHSVPQDERLGIAPDVPVSLSSQAYLANQDPALDVVRRFLSGK